MNNPPLDYTHLIVDKAGQCGGCEHWQVNLGDPLIGKCLRDDTQTDRSDGCCYWQINEDLKVP